MDILILKVVGLKFLFVAAICNIVYEVIIELSKAWGHPMM
jgi:hypothetical protein